MQQFSDASESKIWIFFKFFRKNLKKPYNLDFLGILVLKPKKLGSGSKTDFYSPDTDVQKQNSS